MDLTKIQEFINANQEIALDIETTGLSVHNDSIVGIGFHNGNTGIYLKISAYIPSKNGLESCHSRDSVQVLLSSLRTRRLICHNGSFDLRFIAAQFGVNLLEALHCDTMLLKHTCDEEFPFGLKEIATKLWGVEVKAEKEAMQASIKKNGGSAAEYYKADPELLEKYCLQDCALTMRIYKYYSLLLAKEGLETFFYEDEVMPLYREVVIPMEMQGVRLDVPFMQQSLKEITQDLQDLEHKIQAAIRPHLGLFEEWFLNKDYPPARSGAFAQGIALHYGLPLPKTKSGAYSLTEKNITALPDNLARSVLLQEAYLPPEVIPCIQRTLWESESKGYMFNLLSKHHLKKLFFDTLNEHPTSTTEKGNPQVDEEFLESVAPKYKWVRQLIEFNKLTKIKSTYIERFLDEQIEGVFYPSFQQHRTVSGRLAGDLQQLPRPLEEGQASDLVVKHTNRIRAFFIPSSNNNKLISADYESLEPHIFAHVSGDPALCSIFETGLDFYSEVAIKTERLTGVSSRKSDENYLGKVNKAARQKAKAYALGIAYGMTGYKLKFEIGCDEETAEKLVNDYLTAFPKLARWMNESKDKAKFKGFIKTEAGRVRHLSRAREIFEKYGECINNDLVLWKAYHSVPEMYAVARGDRKEYKNLLNNAINFQIQGLAATLMNRAAININRRLQKANLGAKLIIQVHDELVYDVPQNEIEQVAAIVKDSMETVAKLKVPLRVEPQIGNNFKECK